MEELLRTPDIGRREQLLLMVHRFRHVEIDASMHLLASALVDADVLPPAYYDDALHIAAASMSQADVLLSWNFRHLVNRRRRAMVNLLLSTRGRPTMEIIAPPEL